MIGPGVSERVEVGGVGVPQPIRDHLWSFGSGGLSWTLITVTVATERRGSMKPRPGTRTHPPHWSSVTSQRGRASDWWRES